jgi:hypothetical protein
MLRQKILVLLGSLVVVGLAACGGATGVASSAAPAANGARASAVVPQGTAAAQAPASSAAKPAANGAVPTTARPPGTRLQLTASVTLQVPNGRFDGALSDVIALVEAAGGYISGQNAQAADAGQPLRSGQVTFQVPSGNLDSVLASLRGKGTAQSVNVSGNDVSQQYVDLQARLSNAEAQRDAMLALMQQARSVNDTIQIENQLGQITGQIEELKGQIDYLDHTTSYSTLAVTIREAAAAASHDEWGVQTAASQAVHNFTSVLAFLIVAIGTLAPLVVVAAVAFLGGRMAWRRLSPGRP